MLLPMWAEREIVGGRMVTWGTLLCGRELLEGWALLRVYIQSGVVPWKGGYPEILEASERIWWAAEGLAEAPEEVLLASGTLVPQSWPRHLGCCLPAVVHRGLWWRQVWQGRRKKIALRWS